MAQATRTQGRSQVKYDHIIKSGVAIATRHGVASITHRSVAAEAKVSVSSMTYYFKSLLHMKQLITEYLFEVEQNRRLRVVKTLGQQEPHDLARLLVKCIHPNIASPIETTHLLQASIEAVNYPNGPALLARRHQHISEAVMLMLEHFGTQIDTDRAIATVNGRVLQWIGNPVSGQVNELVAQDLGF